MPFYYATKRDYGIWAALLIGIPTIFFGLIWLYGVANEYANGIDPFKKYPVQVTPSASLSNQLYSKQAENDTVNYQQWCLKNGKIWVSFDDFTDGLPYCENVYGEKIHQ